MKLYLMRHGTALLPHVDLSRPLSPEGRDEVTAVGNYLSRLDLKPSHIYHSGKTRAKETALIVASCIEGPAPEEHAHLAPDDPPDEAGAVLEAMDENVMVVGHLPHLPRLASWFLLGGRERPVLGMTCASVACLDGDSGGWELLWLLRPDLLQ